MEFETKKLINDKLKMNNEIGKILKEINESQSEIYKVDNQLEKAIENKKFIDEVLMFCLGKTTEDL